MYFGNNLKAYRVNLIIERSDDLISFFGAILTSFYYTRITIMKAFLLKDHLINLSRVINEDAATLTFPP